MKTQPGLSTAKQGGASQVTNLRVVGVKELHGTNEGADDASKAHGSQHLPGQALRLAALLAASWLGSTC